MQKLSRALSSEKPVPPVLETEEEPDPIPLIREPLTELQVVLPQEFDAAKDSFEHFFNAVSLCKEPLAFELLGTHKKIVTQFAASSNDATLLRRQLQSFFPEAQYRQCKDTLANAWLTRSGEEALVVEFGLAQEFMFSLATPKSDPFISIIGALSELRPDEIGLFQVLWQPIEEDFRPKTSDFAERPHPKRTAEVAPPLPSGVSSEVPELPKAAEPVSVTLEEEKQHDAIKERIRVQAETLDYSVAFEEFVADTQGRADVVLRRGNHSIACEITVTTPVEYEVANLTKCLNGNFQHVAAISRNKKKLERIRESLVQTASPEQIARVGFYLPEEFISKLYDWAMDDPEGGVMEKGKPKKRKIAFNIAQLTGIERKQREDEMLKGLAEAMKQK
jgi:hypothetical protein